MAALNIKSQRVVDLAKVAASRTGTTQVAAVEAALEEYLERLEHPAPETGSRKERAARTLNEIRHHLTDDDRAEIRSAMDEMYDDAGLPVR